MTKRTAQVTTLVCSLIIILFTILSWLGIKP